MLYEMLTGRPPFLGDDAVAIISQHINTPPVAPAWHNPAVPKSLETLTLQLLAKDPEAIGMLMVPWQAVRCARAVLQVCHNCAMILA